VQPGLPVLWLEIADFTRLFSARGVALLLFSISEQNSKVLSTQSTFHMSEGENRGHIFPRIIAEILNLGHHHGSSSNTVGSTSAPCSLAPASGRL